MKVLAKSPKFATATKYGEFYAAIVKAKGAWRAVECDDLRSRDCLRVATAMYLRKWGHRVEVVVEGLTVFARLVKEAGG